MRPVIERTQVTAQCLHHHRWNTVILPGSTLPIRAECPTCGRLVLFYVNLKEKYGPYRTDRLAEIGKLTQLLIDFPLDDELWQKVGRINDYLLDTLND